MAEITLFRDDFNDTSINLNHWKLPAPTLLGRTQLRLNEFPLVTDGVVRLRLDTFNPTTPGDSFLGSEIQTIQTFDLDNERDGLAFEARVRVVNSQSNPLSRGMVAAFFTFALDEDGSNRDEIDFELLTNEIENSLVGKQAAPRLHTNIFNDTFLPGDPVDLVELGLDLTQFNTFRIEWFPDSVEWLVNGNLIRREFDTVPDEEMDLRLNFWAPDSEWSEAYDASLQLASRPEDNQTFFYEVDYVQIEQLAEDKPNNMTIQFSDFSDISDLTLNPEATQAGNVLRLVPSENFNKGSAFITSPISIEADTSFNSRFEFEITDSDGLGGGGGDGFVFMLHNDPAEDNALGDSGGNLGYNAGGENRIDPSVAVQFDIFPNTADNDPNDNHIGLNLKGNNISEKTATPSFDLNSGNPINVWVDYEGTTDLLEVFLSTTYTKPAIPLLSSSVDLSNIGSQAFVGFSAANGGSGGNYDILNWEFSYTTTPPRIKADFNGNGSNDLVYQSTLPVGNLQAWSIFYDSTTGAFETFTPNVNTPGLVASAVGQFDQADNNPEVLYYDPVSGNNFLLNPLDPLQWTTLSDPNNAEAILQTPGLVPKTAADFNGDGIFEIVYRNESNPAFASGQNFTYDPITRQFSFLNVTEDLPLAAGQLDTDKSVEIVYGEPISGEYRVYDVNRGTFSDLFADPAQIVPGFLARGTLNANLIQPDLVLFQSQTTAETVSYNPATGTFDDILTTTPGFVSLA